HVTLPRAIAQYIPRNRLMSEREWRSYGVMQSEGWEHYMIHGEKQFHACIITIALRDIPFIR
ncbi:1665_t:CDS:1, partial [Ambispora leptoticha]